MEQRECQCGEHDSRLFPVPAQTGDDLLAEKPFLANRRQQSHKQCIHPLIAAEHQIIDTIRGLTIGDVGRQHHADDIAEVHHRNAYDEKRDEFARLHGKLAGADGGHAREHQHAERHGHQIQRARGGQQHRPRRHIVTGKLM